MIGWLGDAYLWVKAVHVIFVIFWMAGLFMLPRFYAYHTEVAYGSTEELAWRQREVRLLRIIINPAMILTWICGLCLAFHLGFKDNGWLSIKILLVLGLTGYHGMMGAWRRKLADGSNVRTTRFFRLMNEVPTLVTIPIVILVIVKPF
jgi:protoporphyrinogen IX oxidase